MKIPILTLKQNLMSAILLIVTRITVPILGTVPSQRDVTNTGCDTSGARSRSRERKQDNKGVKQRLMGQGIACVNPPAHYLPHRSRRRVRMRVFVMVSRRRPSADNALRIACRRVVKLDNQVCFEWAIWSCYSC